MTSCALVVGANGAIGSALVRKLLSESRETRVLGICRQVPKAPVSGCEYQVLSEYSEDTISHCLAQCIGTQACRFVAIASGVLHSPQQQLKPEKRLEDVDAESLLRYVQSNSIIPMLWIKHLLPYLKHNDRADLVCLSARVGSIEDNGLGGWYGYRCSKAALNMLIKTAAVEYRRRAPNVVLSCYHPGTVDSELSRPFHANVPEEKLFTADFTAARLFDALDRCVSEQSPYFIDWQGKKIPW